MHFSQLVPIGSYNVYLSDTRIYLTLKKHLYVDNECKCHIITFNMLTAFGLLVNFDGLLESFIITVFLAASTEETITVQNI